MSLVDKDIELIIQAIVDKAKKSTVPILELDKNPKSEESLERLSNGTGTLFNIENEHFLVTASHVIEDVESGKSIYAIPTGKLGNELYTFGKGRICRENNYDVAVYKFEEEKVIDMLKQSWSFLTIDDVVSSQSQSFDGFVLCGFPSQNISVDQWHINSTPPTTIITRMYIGAEEIPNKLQYEIALTHQKLGKNKDGIEVDVDHMSGMSGCSVFAFSTNKNITNKIWNTKENVKIIAIQKSMHPDKYIRCTEWKVVYNVIKDCKL